MNERDRQSLDAIKHTIECDARVREDVQRALEYHDRAFFGQVVACVVERLQLPVLDVVSFAEGLYERFRGRF